MDGGSSIAKPCGQFVFTQMQSKVVKKRFGDAVCEIFYGIFTAYIVQLNTLLPLVSAVQHCIIILYDNEIWIFAKFFQLAKFNDERLLVS